MKYINISELEERLGEVELIDIRESYEYQAGYIPTAKNIPMNELIKNPSNYLNLNQEYYVVCQSGGRSEMACLVLEAQGFKVNNVAGGTSAYNGKLD